MEKWYVVNKIIHKLFKRLYRHIKSKKKCIGKLNKTISHYTVKNIICIEIKNTIFDGKVDTVAAADCRLKNL